jgi:membrane fusion protein (multidrug efflux system)
MNASTESEQAAVAVPPPAPVAATNDWKRRYRLPLMILGPIVVAIGVAYFYLSGGRYESTDDAYVQAARVAISANVAGRVAELDVRENQLVHQRDVLFRLDAAPFRIWRRRACRSSR